MRLHPSVPLNYRESFGKLFRRHFLFENLNPPNDRVQWRAKLVRKRRDKFRFILSARFNASLARAICCVARFCSEISRAIFVSRIPVNRNGHSRCPVRTWSHASCITTPGLQFPLFRPGGSSAFNSWRMAWRYAVSALRPAGAMR